MTQDDLVVCRRTSAKVSHFSQANDLPVSIGVLDTSGGMERKISTATTAVERFIRSVHKDDDIFLMTFANRPEYGRISPMIVITLRKPYAELRSAALPCTTHWMKVWKIKKGKHDKGRYC
jgi:hypothetical protein